MKIKIIELLSKIANGEYPKKFKYNGKIYEYKKIVQGTGYVTENYNWFNSDIYIDDWYNLNNEVEIIEEDKPIERENETENLEELGIKIGQMYKELIRGIIKGFEEEKNQ